MNTLRAPSPMLAAAALALSACAPPAWLSRSVNTAPPASRGPPRYRAEFERPPRDPAAPVAVVFGPAHYGTVETGPLPVEIENRTKAPISIDWDRSALVDPSGRARRLLHAGVPWVDRNAPQEQTTIPPGAKHRDAVLPADVIRWLADRDAPQGGAWRLYRFLPIEGEDRSSLRYRVRLVVALPGGLESVLEVPLDVRSVTLVAGQAPSSRDRT